MKKIVFLCLLYLLGSLSLHPSKIQKKQSFNQTNNYATYYVRTDGGTASQCTGTSDAPYPGSGNNQACAWSHPFWALDSGGNWKLQGGDTLIIGPGEYMIGYGAPNTSGWCESSYAYDCTFPPIAPRTR